MNHISNNLFGSLSLFCIFGCYSFTVFLFIFFSIDLQQTCELMWRMSNKYSHLFEAIMKIAFDKFVLRLLVPFHYTSWQNRLLCNITTQCNDCDTKCEKQRNRTKEGEDENA